jgi:hypothetical protein
MQCSPTSCLFIPLRSKYSPHHPVHIRSVIHILSLSKIKKIAGATGKLYESDLVVSCAHLIHSERYFSLIALFYTASMIGMKTLVEGELALQSEVLGENLSLVQFFSNPTWSDLGSNLRHWHGKADSERFRYGTTQCNKIIYIFLIQNCLIIYYTYFACCPSRVFKFLNWPRARKVERHSIGYSIEWTFRVSYFSSGGSWRDSHGKALLYIAEPRVRTRVTLWEIRGERSCTGAGIFLRVSSAFPC